MSKTFHLGDLLSVTTGTLLAPTKMRGVSTLLEHLTGVRLEVHQLLIASEVCAPLMVRDRPWLADLRPPKGADLDDLVAWISWAVSVHGEWHEVDSYPPNVWGEHDSFVDFLRLKIRQATRKAWVEPFEKFGESVRQANEALAGLNAALKRTEETQ